MFHGFDSDGTMLRIGSMNRMLHGVDNPDIRYRDSLAQEHTGGYADRYSLVLAPPFAGAMDAEWDSPYSGRILTVPASSLYNANFWVPNAKFFGKF